MTGFVTKTDNTRPVLSCDGHRTHRQCGIHSIVQQAQAVKCHLHRPALIYDAIHRLTFLIGIHVYHQLASGTSRRLPVDTPDIITADILPYQLEGDGTYRRPADD